MHSHIDFTELAIVLEDKAIHQVGDESFHIEKGNVFVMKKHSSHVLMITALAGSPSAAELPQRAAAFTPKFRK